MTVTASDVARVYKNADMIYSESEVDATLDRMAEEITVLLGGKDPIVLCIMNGGLVATGKLLPKLDFPLRVDYLHATRYKGQTSAGELNWLKRNHHELKDQYVLVVDDILDEGITLQAVVDFCNEMGATKVYSAVVVEKLHERGNGFKADFLGLEVDDRYLFGYGMDYKGYLRNAPGIFALSPEDEG